MDPDEGGFRHTASAVRRLVVGPALRISEVAKEQITPVEGLSALSLDALTSVAYGPEAILVTLAAVAGASSLHLVLPITVAIVALLGILVISYRQVIEAYPHGGGAYAVSRDNFGPRASQLAGAALIVDYTLTVAVSIAAGVASLTSAFPRLAGATVPLCLAMLVVLTLLNLRGLGEGARALLVPTLVFIGGLLAIIAIGLIHPLDPTIHQAGTPQLASTAKAVTFLLVLKAFSAGCSALTGVEAIANGVPLFKEPRVARAKRTEALLGIILGVMLLGLAVLANKFHIVPRSGQTVLSQIMAASVGRGWAYYVVSLTITLVLALAANTSFAGLPILGSLLARDDYLPHIFSLRDDRLVFGNGVWALAFLSGILLVVVRGNTNALIPLFAIGVFLGFTLSQAGLVVHWRRFRPPRWRLKATVNGFGAVVTGLATVIFLVSKFTEGAWVVVAAVPLFILLFTRIERYYHRVARQLGFGTLPATPARRRTTVVVPVTQVSRLTAFAISEALSIGQEVQAVTVQFDAQDGQQAADTIEDDWARWQCGIPLTVLHTEYASVVAPVVGYIDDLLSRTDDQIVVLIPTVIPSRLRYRILHNQLDVALSAALRSRADVVVARVTMPIEDAPTPRHPDPPDDGGSVAARGLTADPASGATSPAPDA